MASTDGDNMIIKSEFLETSTMNLTTTEDVVNCSISQGIDEPINGIDYKTLREGLQNNSLLLIDVRDLWELEEFGKLEGSVNLPLPEVDEAFQLSEKAFFAKYGFEKPVCGQSENVVLTCRSGRRVLEACDKLESLGYCKIRIYFGSYLDWKAKGGPLIFPQVKKRHALTKGQF